MNRREALEKYKSQSIHYFENALNAIQAGDAAKAGEFLWGSIALALKAVAASEGKKVKHTNMSAYARELARRKNDMSIWDVYGIADLLHGKGFYEASLSLEEVQTHAERIRTTVLKLFSHIPEEKSEEEPT